jgi:hypothetical protein
MSGLTEVDITWMRDQLFFEGPERSRRLSRFLAPAAAVGGAISGWRGRRLDGHRDRGHDRRAPDDPDPLSAVSLG